MFVRFFSLTKGQQTFKIKPVSIYSQGNAGLWWKEALLVWSSVLALLYGTQSTLNLNIYLHSYKTETVIFTGTKHGKTIMAVI